MKPIKVNFKKLDGTKTSTTLSYSVCKMYGSVFFGVELHHYDSGDDYYNHLAKLVQAFVNEKSKLTDEVELELHKDFIEDMMLRECMKKIRSDNGIG